MRKQRIEGGVDEWADIDIIGLDEVDESENDLSFDFFCLFGPVFVKKDVD